MEKENEEIKILADIFFQNESYSSDGVKGDHRQVSLKKAIPLIGTYNQKIIVESYNLAIKRITKTIDRIFEVMFYLSRDRNFDLKEYFDTQLPFIYTYLMRIYEIRDIFIETNNRNISMSQKRNSVTRMLGDFEDVFFLEDEILKFVPKENLKDKNISELIKFIKKEYIEYSEGKIAGKRR